MIFDKYYSYDIVNGGVVVGSGMVAVRFYDTPRKAYDDVIKDLVVSYPNHAQINFRRIR